MYTSEHISTLKYKLNPSFLLLEVYKMAEVSKAKSKYASKVCDTYLGISESACEGAFDKLVDNMKAGLKALA